MKQIYFIVLLGFFLVVINACSSKDITNEIVGSWKSGDMSFTFYPDGRFREGRSKGTYRIDGSKVLLRYKGLSSDVVYEAGIEEDTLELEMHDKKLGIDRSRTFKRQPDMETADTEAVEMSEEPRDSRYAR